jgi:hypothetical protein
LLWRLKSDRKPIEGDWGIEGEEGRPLFRRSRGPEAEAAVATPMDGWEEPLTERVEEARAFLRDLRTHLISMRREETS